MAECWLFAEMFTYIYLEKNCTERTFVDLTAVPEYWGRT